MSSNTNRRRDFERMMADVEANSRRAATLPEANPSSPRISSYAVDDPVVHRQGASASGQRVRVRVPA